MRVSVSVSFLVGGRRSEEVALLLFIHEIEFDLIRLKKGREGRNLIEDQKKVEGEEEEEDQVSELRWSRVES